MLLTLEHIPNNFSISIRNLYQEDNVLIFFGLEAFHLDKIDGLINRYKSYVPEMEKLDLLVNIL
jgi:hypothetical protein